MHRCIECRRNIEHIDVLFDEAQVFEAIVKRVTARQELVCADAAENRETGTHLLAHLARDEREETGTVLGASAKLVGAMVGEWRKELADKV